MNLSLEALLQRLVARGHEIYRQTPTRDDSPAPTTLRLKPATKHFLQAQAEALSTSLQGMIGLILDGVAEATTNDPASRLRTMRERFFYLADAHQLDLPAIASLLQKHGFTLSALGSTERMADLMNREAIAFYADQFFVQPEWLTASSDRIVPHGSSVRWYKNVPAMARELVQHAQAGLRPHLMVIKRRGANLQTAFKAGDSPLAKAEPIGAVLKLTRQTPDGVSFDVYQVWEFERWNYWRCREQFKLLIAFCDEMQGKGLHMDGYTLPAEAIEALVSGRQMPVAVLAQAGPATWAPEHYASVRATVKEEVEEWVEVGETYRKSQLPGIASGEGS